MSDHAPSPIVIDASTQRPRGRYADVVFGARRRARRRDDWPHWPTLGRLLKAVGYSFAIAGPCGETYELEGCTWYGWQLGRDGDRRLINDCRLYIGDDSPETVLTHEYAVAKLVIVDRAPHQARWPWHLDRIGQLTAAGGRMDVRGADARPSAVFVEAWEFLNRTCSAEFAPASGCHTA